MRILPLKQLRFEHKLLLVFVGLSLLLLAAVVVIALQFESRLIFETEKDIDQLVQTVHFSAQKLSAEKGADLDALMLFIQEAKANRAVKEVSVIGSNEEVVASSNPSKVGQRRNLPGGEIVVREQFGVRDSSGHHIHYIVRVPLLRDNRVIGLVETSIFVDDIRYLLRQFYLRTLALSVLVLVVILGVAYVALRKLSQPLRDLTIAAARVAEGDLTVALAPSGTDEVGRLADSFNAMTGKLAEQRLLEDRVRELERHALLTEMAASLAHEIRNPLNLINLTADHLASQFKPQRSDHAKSFVDLIAALKDEVRHLNQMVEAFLQSSRPPKIARQRFPFQEIASQVITLLKVPLAQKRVTVATDIVPQAEPLADKEQLRLVLLNLVLNASQAVPEGGAIDIAARQDGDAFTFTVSDNGPGIPQGSSEQVFEPYYTERPGGTGLGLALARRIIEQHGGSISARNLPGSGAQFEVTIPMTAEDHAHSTDR